MTRRMIAPLLFGLIGVAILVSLGSWQVRRLEWKTGVIADIDGRLAAAAVAVPPDPTAEADQYLRVRTEGSIEPGELHVYTTGPGGGVGYRVIAPLALPDGRRILVDRGFVPIDEKDAPRPVGAATLEGNLAWPRETDSFTAAPDRDRNIWFARDVPLMAAALDADPVLLVAAGSPAHGAPLPMPVTASLRNDHLQYAITWFSLAVIWTLMTGYLLWRIKRRTV